MKKTILATMLMALSLGTAHATNWGNSNGPTNNNTTNTANSSATGIGIGTGGSVVGSGNSSNYNGNSNSNSNYNGNSNSNKNNNSNSNKQGQAQGQMQGQSTENANNSSQSVNVEGDTYEASDLSDLAPPVYAPSLTTGSCMGSVSGGLSAPGFGISAGSTVKDEECQIRFNSIRLQQLGMDKASVFIMCQVDTAKLALEQSGFVCPVKEEERKSSSNAPKPIWDKK